MTYNPRSIFQSYDQYGRAKKKQASKPNPGKQFADSMKAGGGGRNMSGIGAKPAPSRTSTFDQFKRRERNKGLGSRPSFGGAQDNNPNRDEAENKSSVKKLYEKTVNFLKSFGTDEPEALIVDGQRVYQGPAFRGFQPTIPTENFGGRFGKQQYLFDSPELGIKTTRSPVPPTLPPGTVNRLGVNRDNPRLNMFGVSRGFTKPPASPELPTSPDVPANVDAITRGISQALIPTEVEYTIKVGDTLSEIAEDRGTTVEVLMELNNIKEKDKDTIFAGDKLKVPPKKAKTYKDVDDDKFASSGQIMSDAIDPDSEFYQSFRQGVTPDSLMVDSYSFMDEGSELMKALRAKEADNYDTIFDNAEKRKSPFKGTKVSNKTIKEVLNFVELDGEFHKYNKQKGFNTTAVGKYQIVGNTLRDLDRRGVLKSLGITDNTKFDGPTQDKIAAHLAVNRIKNRATGGDGTLASRKNAREEMRKEWEGFKKLSNRKLDKIIDEIAEEIGVTIYEGIEMDPITSKSLRPKVRPKGLGAK